MSKFTSKKLVLASIAVLALGALFTRRAMADTQPQPAATWETLFGDDDAGWNNLLFINGYGGGSYSFNRSTSLGNSAGTVVKGSGGLIVGVAPPPISPWKP